MEFFSRCSSFKVGDDSKIVFGTMGGKAVFLELYSISDLRDASMASHLQFSNGFPQWNVNFDRGAHE
jgi:hypothetical protein